MATAREVVEKCKAMSQTQLRQYGKEKYRQVWDVLCNYISGFDIAKATIDSLVVCAGLDGKFTYGEWEFIKYVFNIHECNYDYYCEKVEALQTIQMKRDVSEFKKAMPSQARGPFICLCIALMCSDCRFTYEDLDFLEDCLLG